MTASRKTQNDPTDTMQIRIIKPPKRRFWRSLAAGFAARWERIWPPLVGCLLGISAGVTLWLLFLIWWLGL